jgi:hypothetical protein
MDADHQGGGRGRELNNRGLFCGAFCKEPAGRSITAWMFRSSSPSNGAICLQCRRKRTRPGHFRHVFSATASFTAAAVTGSIGALTLRSALAKHDYRILPLASFPLLFAAQQLVEGFLWLDLAGPEPGVCRTILIHAFSGYAEVFWPIFAPLAALLVEPERWRRRLMMLCLAVGLALSAYLLVKMVTHPYDAFVGSGHIVYENGFQYPSGLEFPYLVATTISLLLSSHKVVQLMAFVILVGFAVAYISFYESYPSIWCFFAAAASVLVYLFISRAPQSDLQPRTP